MHQFRRHGFLGWGFGVPPFFRFHWGPRPFPRRAEYLRLLEEYQAELEQELAEVRQEISDLKGEPGN